MFGTNRKKILLLSGVGLLFLLILGVTWWLFVQSQNINSDTGGVFFGDTSEEIPGYVPPTTSDAPSNTISTGPTNQERRLTKLWQVTDVPVAAATVYRQGGDASTTPKWFIRYIERGLGHVYEQDVTQRDNTRLSITRVQRIQEAFWLPADPNIVLVRYLDASLASVQTYVATLTRLEENNNRNQSKQNAFFLAGSFLEENILEATPANNLARVFYLVRSGDKTLGKIWSPDGSITTVYDSPLRELLPQWTDTNTIAITNKAAVGSIGATHLFNINSGEERPLGQGVTHLSNTNHNNTRSLLFEHIEQRPAVSFYNITTGTKNTLRLATLPEKCAWGRFNTAIIYCAIPATGMGKNEPDYWYQGKTSFTDEVWQINAITYEANLLANQSDFERLGEEGGVDAVQLTLAPDDRYLTFINRKTGSLWAVELTAPTPEPLEEEEFDDFDEDPLP